jgi:hypothetical protein
MAPERSKQHFRDVGYTAASQQTLQPSSALSWTLQSDSSLGLLVLWYESCCLDMGLMSYCFNSTLPSLDLKTRTRLIREHILWWTTRVSGSVVPSGGAAGVRSSQRRRFMTSEQYEQAAENVTVLLALGHRRLRDGRIADGRAEGLLDIVKAWQESTSPQLDVAGLVFAA